MELLEAAKGERGGDEKRGPPGRTHGHTCGLTHARTHTDAHTQKGHSGVLKGSLYLLIFSLQKKKKVATNTDAEQKRH